MAACISYNVTIGIDMARDKHDYLRGADSDSVRFRTIDLEPIQPMYGYLPACFQKDVLNWSSAACVDDLCIIWIVWLD